MASEYSDAAVEAHYLDAYRSEYGTDYFGEDQDEPDPGEAEWENYIKESERW